MTPDKVVVQFKISSEMIENNGRKFGLNEYEKDLLEAIESAISLLQDYQKLRERVSKEKIQEVLSECPSKWVEDKAQAIVTYLRGESNG